MTRTTQKQLKSEIIYLKDKNKKLLEQLIDMCKNQMELHALLQKKESLVNEHNERMEQIYRFEMTAATKGI